MSKGLLASLAVLLAGASFSFAQQPGPAPVIVPGDGLGSVIAGCDRFDDAQCWVRAEYLLWWTKDSPVRPPLVTGVAPGTPTGGNPVPGAIGGANTSVLIGQSELDLGQRNGGKFTVGSWFDRTQTWGIEGNYFFLSSDSATQTANSIGGLAAPILMTPFTDVTGDFSGGTPGPSAILPAYGQLFAVPGGLNGPFVTHDTLSVSSRLMGAELNFLGTGFNSGRLRVEGIGGFRWLNLTEQLQFDTYNQTLAGAPTDIVYNTTDSFGTINNFYGGQLGFRVSYSPTDGRSGMFYRGAFKLALGDTSERTNIDGSTTTNLGNPPLGSAATTAGGIFSQPTNIGGHDTNHFAVLPEVELNVGYSIASWARVFVGYDFLYISDVVRPGNQIDPKLNLYRSTLVQTAQPAVPAPATNPPSPLFNAMQSSFWAQGINFGVDLLF